MGKSTIIRLTEQEFSKVEQTLLHSTEQEFSKLQQTLLQTADDAVNCLKVLKGNLAEFDSRHKLFFANTSKFFMRSDIRAAKDTASELRSAANQICECKSPSESEITAARSAMHATSDAMNELARAARMYDKKNLKSKGITGIVAGLFGGKKETTKPNKRNDHVYIQNHRMGSEGILRAPDTVEEVVTSTLCDCFSGFSTLQHQIAIAEKSLSPLFSGSANTVISLGGLAATVLLVLFVAGFFSGTKKVADDPAEVLRGGERGGLAALRKRKDRKKRNAEREDAAAPAEVVAPDQNEAVDAEGGPVEPRAMTKKELQKELKRREREELRQFDQQQREERQRISDEKEAAYQKKREEEAKIEQALEEQERKLKEEKERKEKEEFDQWKDMFSIEEQGTKLEEDCEESQMLLQQFVDYVKSHKVVLLEDLASEFNLATQDAIERVESLQASNRLTGIVDDRGKFIYITEEEMDKVAKFIQRRGRLGFAELSKECNKLIRLDGEAAKNVTSSLDWLNNEDQSEGAVADLST
ncbi:hypothetical protein PHMEG_0001688 [Phytophthora megakarya]|uniref:DDRGK domain-containing protein 1 n=1 Tax=Phytophthora megakarya TaxID=4795 RepID=A0A225X2L9_9STRA|nr:hypothetical protein PHMEG_0001688 [Phytophthora megakarya]